MGRPCQMPERSGGWVAGFPAAAIKPAEMSASIPSGHTTNLEVSKPEAADIESAEPENCSRIFKRSLALITTRRCSLLRRDAAKLFAIGLDQRDQSPDLRAALGGIERHLDHISRLKALPAPAVAHEHRRRAGFQEPVRHLA